jgi:hypothetical protein
MQTTLRRIGMVLCVVGLSLGLIAIGALFVTPVDPTGAGMQYDRQVESYNERMKELADTHPNFPAAALGQTRLQAHRANATFGVVVAGVMTFVGAVLCNRYRIALLTRAVKVAPAARHN